SDVAFLFELQQRRIDRSVIDCQLIPAGLLDATRDAVAVQWPQRFERLENHQRERPLPDICLLTHRCNLPLVNLPIGKIKECWHSLYGKAIAGLRSRSYLHNPKLRTSCPCANAAAHLISYLYRGAART